MDMSTAAADPSDSEGRWLDTGVDCARSDPDLIDDEPSRPHRGPVRRFLEARGTIGGHRAPHRRIRLETADGVSLSAVWLPGPSAQAAPGNVPAVVLAHGFAAQASKPAYARLADELSRELAVLALDLRGHGGSDGACTFGVAERHDIAAAVAAMRTAGHRFVAALGVSMGATAVIHAVATGTRVDALVAISGPGFARTNPDTDPLRRLDRRVRSPLSRAALRAALGVVVEPPRRWPRWEDPATLMRQVAVPHLVIHGRDDSWFPVGDAEALAAGELATLWIENRFGHAEDGFTDRFARRLRGAIVGAAHGDDFPPGRQRGQDLGSW